MPKYVWSDGQVREEAPYLCGAFMAATGEQCTKLSDHDGPHVFASDAAAPLVESPGAGPARPIRARYRGEPCTVLSVKTDAYRPALATIVVDGYECSNTVPYHRLEFETPRSLDGKNVADAVVESLGELIELRAKVVAQDAELGRLRAALKDIETYEAPFSRDQLNTAQNTIMDLRAVATRALRENEGAR